MRNKSFLTVFFFLTFFSSFSQNFSLPELDDLLESVDDYYEELTISQKQENEETTKMRWLNYIPSPSYSPFTGGFGVSINVSAPVAELKAKHEKKQRNLSIERFNKLQAKDLKTQINYNYQSIKISIEEYYQHSVIDSLKDKSFNLSQKQYKRNEITPSEFLSLQQGYEVYKLQRKTEENNIKKSILQLLINAKKAVAANNDLTKKP